MYIVFQKTYDTNLVWKMYLINKDMFNIWNPIDINGLRYVYDIGNIMEK